MIFNFSTFSFDETCCNLGIMEFIRIIKFILIFSMLNMNLSDRTEEMKDEHSKTFEEK